MTKDQSHAALLPIPLKPGKQKFEFRAYQIDDLARAAMHDGVVFSWDPGLGKTIAGFTWAILKGGRMNLIVAPEGLHEQIRDEAMERFGFDVRPLLSQEAFHADPTLRKAALEFRNGEEISTTGWWITSYTALGYNGGDMWEPKEDQIGREIVNSTILNRRTAHPNYKAEFDYGIGSGLALGGNARCIFTPSLALLIADLFDLVICDEGVRLKSDESYISLGVRELHPRFRFVLTATPIKNRLEDIFWLAHWACNAGLDEATARWPYANTNKAREEFANEHMLSERNHTRETEHVCRTGVFRTFTRRTPQICNIHRLWKLLGPVVLRRRKDDTGEDLVPKTIIPIRVRPGTAQQAVYKFHLDNKPKVAKNGEPMVAIAAAIAQLQNLRQAALCPETKNLTLTGLSADGLRMVISRMRKEAKNPSADAKLTDKAVLVARKGESLLVSHGPDSPASPGEADAALQILEKMSASGKIDINKIIAVAPSFEEKLRTFLDTEASPSARSWTDHNPKQAAILKLIEHLLSKGEQVVVMSPFIDFSIGLHRRLVEAGVSVCCLDGRLSPKKRGQFAKQFKRQKFSVLIGGIQSMGEGHSLECCSNLILPSIEWAYDKNRQSEDRVHRINSLKPVTIYTLVTENTIDVRLESVYREKGDSSNLALDGRLFSDRTEEINLGELLRDAVKNFDPHASTIDEQDIEAEWEQSLKQKLGHAEERFREWHPPIAGIPFTPKVTRKEVREATADATDGTYSPVVQLVKGIPTATFAALIGSTNREEVEIVRECFTGFCARHPQHKDWRRAWSAFEQSWGNYKLWIRKQMSRATVAKTATVERTALKDKPTAQDAADYIEGL